MRLKPFAFSIAQIQHFVAVARTGSISQAAQTICVSQSAVSASIQRLERRIGSALFIRHHAKGVTLSPRGRELLEFAEEALEALQKFDERSKEISVGSVGRLAVGFERSVSHSYLPSVLRFMTSRYPRLEIEAIEGGADEIERLLLGGEIEAALAYDVGISAALRFRAIAETRPHVVVSSKDPLAEHTTVNLESLDGAVLIAPRVGESSRFIAALLTEGNVRPSQVISASSYETMRSLVASGMGFAVIIQRMHSGADLGSIHELAIADPVPTVRLGVVVPVGALPSDRANAFLAACQARQAELTVPGRDVGH